jgi:hypothetical protein
LLEFSPNVVEDSFDTVVLVKSEFEIRYEDENATDAEGEGMVWNVGGFEAVTGID